MPKPPRVTGREIARALERHGFILSRVRESHHIYRHSESRVWVVVPIHANRVMPPGTLANILRHIGIDRETFRHWLME